MKQHPPAVTADSCVKEATVLAVASGNLLRSAGGVIVAAPSVIAEVPAILGFIGSAIATAASAAAYLNCKDEAAAKK